MNPREGALAVAVRRDDWERAALLLLVALAHALRNAPPGTIEDLLALLASLDGAGDGDG
jgi:hypothetical protein